MFGCTIASSISMRCFSMSSRRLRSSTPQRSDAKEPPEGIDIAFVTGAVRNEENRERLRKIRKHSKTLVHSEPAPVTAAYQDSRCWFKRRSLPYIYREVETAKPDGSSRPIYHRSSTGRLRLGSRKDRLLHHGLPAQGGILKEIIPAMIAGTPWLTQISLLRVRQDHGTS